MNLLHLFEPSTTEDKVTCAYISFANFIAKHNLAFMADHFTPLVAAMFKDSKIAKAFSSARMKTTCIVRAALHPHFYQAVIKLCQMSPFSILCGKCM